MSTTSPFVSGKILPALIKFSLPLLFALMLQALYGGVDLMVVGYFCDASSVSAVATGSTFLYTITVIFTGLTMGVTICLGTAIGSEDKKLCGTILSGQIRLLFIITLVLTSLIICFAPNLAQLLHAPSEALEETTTYIRICGMGLVFIAAYNGIAGVFRGLGNSKVPFVFVGIACGINIILDILFVGVLHLGASGAALATIISQGSSVIFSLLYIKTHPLPFRIPKEKLLCFKGVSHILRVGAPIALQDFIISLSFLILAAIINTLGVVSSAGVGISEKLFLFLALIPMTFLSTLSAFVSHNVGANQPERGLQAMKQCLMISGGAGFCITTFIIFFAEFLIGIFSNDSLVIEAGSAFLRGSSLEYVLIGISYCFLGYFTGHGKTTFVMFQGIFTSFGIRIPLSYFLSQFQNPDLFVISTAIPISALVSLALCIAYFIFLTKTGINKHKTHESHSLH